MKNKIVQQASNNNFTHTYYYRAIVKQDRCILNIIIIKC